MALNTAALNVAANSLRSAITHLAIHTALPDATTGTNQSAAARQAVTWGAASNGDFSASNIAFTGGAASGPALYVGYWSASTGGTFYGFKALTGDQTFNAAGAYTISSITINGDSS